MKNNIEVLQKMKNKTTVKVRLLSRTQLSCPILCDPMDGSLPGSSVHGIFQARILEWVAIFFSKTTIPSSNSASGYTSERNQISTLKTYYIPMFTAAQ